MDASGHTDTPLIDGLVDMATRAFPLLSNYMPARQAVGSLWSRMAVYLARLLSNTKRPFMGWPG